MRAGLSLVGWGEAPSDPFRHFGIELGYLGNAFLSRTRDENRIVTPGIHIREGGGISPNDPLQKVDASSIFLFEKIPKYDQKTDMERIDRLSTLMARFRLSARLAPPGEATLVATREAGGLPGRVFLGARPVETGVDHDKILLCATVDWGGDANPLFLALPDLMIHDLSQDAGTYQLLEMIDTEIRMPRCGGETVIGRLIEVLLVRILRGQIEAGSVETGLLAGLSDARLSRSIVAIHDQPERLWTNDDLAQVAGLSLSRFVELFQARVGETPAAYLRRWRLTLASQELALGARVERVAHRYGFRSAEGFSRAFKRQFGQQPRAMRKAAQSVAADKVPS